MYTIAEVVDPRFVATIIAEVDSMEEAEAYLRANFKHVICFERDTPNDAADAMVGQGFKLRQFTVERRD